jgi:hypothetical protein
MSVNYCENHDHFFDEDFTLECPKCEAESIQAEALKDGQGFDTTELDQESQTVTLKSMTWATGLKFKESGKPSGTWTPPDVKLTHEEFTTMMAIVGLLWFNEIGFTDVTEDALVDETDLDLEDALQAIHSLKAKELVEDQDGFLNLTMEGYKFHPKWAAFQKPPVDTSSKT